MEKSRGNEGRCMVFEFLGFHQIPMCMRTRQSGFFPQSPLMKQGFCLYVCCRSFEDSDRDTLTMVVDRHCLAFDHRFTQKPLYGPNEDRPSHENSFRRVPQSQRRPQSSVRQLFESPTVVDFQIEMCVRELWKGRHRMMQRFIWASSSRVLQMYSDVRLFPSYASDVHGCSLHTSPYPAFKLSLKWQGGLKTVKLKARLSYASKNIAQGLIELAKALYLCGILSYISKVQLGVGRFNHCWQPIFCLEDWLPKSDQVSRHLQQVYRNSTKIWCWAVRALSWAQLP